MSWVFYSNIRRVNEEKIENDPDNILTGKKIYELDIQLDKCKWDMFIRSLKHTSCKNGILINSARYNMDGTYKRSRIINRCSAKDMYDAMLYCLQWNTPMICYSTNGKLFCQWITKGKGVVKDEFGFIKDGISKDEIIEYMKALRLGREIEQWSAYVNDYEDRQQG